MYIKWGYRIMSTIYKKGNRMDAQNCYNQAICLLANVSDHLQAPYVLQERTKNFSPKSKIQIIIWAGPSGVGKGEMARELEKQGIGRIARDATRTKRPNEIHGKDYFFRTIHEFKEMISKDGFVWWSNAGVGGYRGLSIEAINSTLATHRAAYIDSGGESAIDLPRIPKLKAYGLSTVMILPPSFQELCRRMQKRFASDKMADNTQDMQTRLSLAARLLEQTKGSVDMYVVNDAIEDVTSTVGALLEPLNLK